MEPAARTAEPPPLAPTTRVSIFAGRRGNEVICQGVAQALGVEATIRPLAPRRLFALLAPYGPVDPRDRPTAPFPDIALASGRVAVPYLRDLARRSPQTFTVFLQDPRVAHARFDLIWTPEHDRWRGPNAIVTTTSPHPLTQARIADARANPPPRIAAMPGPRLTMVLGGDSRSHRFAEADRRALVGIAVEAAKAGYSLLATPSRRTPDDLVAQMRTALAAAGAAQDRVWIWDGAGDNPYLAMLAAADAILVTGDSANMVGEATATGAAVHVYEPTGGSAKLTRFLDSLVAQGAARRWAGRIERWSAAPIDATATVAAEIRRRYAEFLASGRRPR